MADGQGDHQQGCKKVWHIDAAAGLVRRGQHGVRRLRGAWPQLVTLNQRLPKRPADHTARNQSEGCRSQSDGTGRGHAFFEYRGPGGGGAMAPAQRHRPGHQPGQGRGIKQGGHADTYQVLQHDDRDAHRQRQAQHPSPVHQVAEPRAQSNGTEERQHHGLAGGKRDGGGSR
jgi:hypothetical protein